MALYSYALTSSQYNPFHLRAILNYMSRHTYNMNSISVSIFIPYFLIFLSCYIPFCRSSSNLTDNLALISFKNRLTSDPLQVMSTWNQSTHFCSWLGITCSHKHQRVIRLDLHSTMLVGSLSPSLGNLSFLKEFIMYNNSFTGEIPQEIGWLSRLQILSLENNSFSGEIPSNISRCSNLMILGLGGNSLIGSIPMEFQLLSNLRLFFLYLNNLTGNLPSYLGNITSLVSISVGGNNLVGNIPDTLGNLNNLEVIELGLNNLSGSFPSSFFNLSSLTDIDIPLNQLQGSLPDDMFISFPRLHKLNIGHNLLTGRIPSSVSNASQLMLLALNVNSFTGEVPSFEGTKKLDWVALNRNKLGNSRPDDLNFMSSLLNCTELRLLHLSENNFEGVLPRFIGNFSNLRRLAIGNNYIHGNIPDELGDIATLETLYLWSNDLTGTIPESIGKLQELRILSFPDNVLYGEIPSSFGNLTMMTELYLQQNNLQGTLPSVLGNCQSLLAMDISQNNFAGYLPDEIFLIRSLSEFLDLSSNSLTGSLPSDLTSLEHLVLLNLSNNELSGLIPDTLGSLISLRELYLSNNFFQGNISPPLSSLRSLEILDLSHNNFTGKIPLFLENFSFLRNLNLSFNDFEGEVPIEGVFRNGSQVSVNNNSKLCGGEPFLPLPLCPKNESSKKSRTSHFLKLIISISASVSVLILVLLFAIVYYLKHKGKLISLDDTSKEFLPTISYQSLHKATNGFSETNLLGSGKFSNVYKGILDQNETAIAVKVLKLQVKGAGKSFLAECEALKSIRHRNLVKFLTSCSSVDFQGNEFKALVYPHMVNGSLQDWLVHSDEKKLTLIQRLNISIDVACALDYLHNHSGNSLVHCDIKPSNVLLDGEFVAHVSDFGLARFIQKVNTSQNDTSLGIKGTVGYAAPEYGMGREASANGDIYSYGILLLELFTGKCPTDDVFNNGLTLHDFVKMAIPERVMEISDPTLVYGHGYDYDYQGEETRDEIMDMEYYCFISLFRIGISCSMELPRERMDITRVVNELYSIRNDLFFSKPQQNLELIKPMLR